MRSKSIAIITIVTFLFVSLLPAVSFASNDSLPTESSANIQSSGQADEHSGVNNPVDINDENKKDEKDDNQIDKEAQNDVQEGDNLNNEEDGSNNQVDEATMNNVTDALNNEGKNKSPEEIIAMLEEKNISINDILKVFNHLSDKGEMNKALSDNELESYADVLLGKIENQKEKIQNLHNSLEELSDLYDKVGELEKAIEVQKEAIKSNYKNMEAYKKLGEDLSKKGENDNKVFVNGEQVSFDVQPIAKDGRTLVPIRAIAESLGAQVAWDSVDKTVTLSKDGILIKLTLGQDIAYVNDKTVKLDVPAESINARTLVPVRFVSEAFNSTVNWEPAYHSVVIY